MKKIMALVLVLIMCLGVVSVGYADMGKDEAVMAITLAINSNLETVGVVEDCQFWLTPLDAEPEGDKPTIILDSEHNALAIFGETYATAWIFGSEKVFNVLVAFCNETSVTDTFSVSYR